MRLLFTRNSGILPLGIRVATFSYWNHVDLLWGGTLIGAVGQHAFYGSSRGGVQEVTLEQRLGQPNVVAYAVCEVLLPEEGDAFDFARAQVGKPYDWSGLYGFVLRDRDWQDPEQWFCSELAAAAAIAGGINLLDRDVSRASPGRIFKSSLLTQIKRHPAL